MEYEIVVDGGRYKGDVANALIFLFALGNTEVRMTWGEHRVRTGADIAHQILEREAEMRARKAAA